MSYELEVSGVVVSSTPIGEYDKRVVLLTAERGKIHAFARGAKKLNSKLLAGTNPLTFAKFKLVSGKNAYVLLDVKIINYFEKLKNDLVRVYYGYYFLELSEYFSKENINETETINLLYVVFTALESDNKVFTPDFIKAIFEWKMFAIEGIMPDINSNICGKKIMASTREGLDFVFKTTVTKLFSFNLSDESKKEFIELAEAYRKLNTDKTFNSLEMIKALS